MIKKILCVNLFIFSLSLLSQQAYYTDVDLSLSGIDLKDELATKIITTHTNVLSYGWEANKATDVNPNNAANVFLIYGWENGSDSNCTNDLERGINDNGGNTCDWNREHVYPKSLGTPSFSNSTTPGADGHHIRASDVQRNSQRSNKLFADGSGNSQSVNGGWYPGDQWKGDVARIIMYMYLRYGNQCLPKNVGMGSVNSVDNNMMNLFLEWNAEDPVSEQEDQRNTYLSNANNAFGQGNRNPFIDNPNLATQIWGGPAAEDRWSTAGLEDNLFTKILTYPNPTTNGKVTVVFPSNIEITNVEVFSVLGKKIYGRKNPTILENKINIRQLKTGIYLLKLSNNTQSITKKLVVQ